LGFILFPPIIAGVAILCAVANQLANSLWRSQQPDSSAYVSYQSACKAHRMATKAYEQELRAWYSTQESWWQTLSGMAFEREISKVLQKGGYSVDVTGAPGDGGVDLKLRRGHDFILVQCKNHKTRVGPSAVRDLFGTLTHHGGTQAWLISTCGFTAGAEGFAHGKPIRLIRLRDLLS